MTAAILSLAAASIGAAAGADVERYEKTLEAKKLLKTLGFMDRYTSWQDDFLARLAKQPDVTSEFHQQLSKLLRESSYEESLADMVGRFMTKDDLVAANKYNAGDVGQKEVAMLLRLERMVKQGELDVSEVAPAEEAFFANLSDEERQQAQAFHNSGAGQRYGRALGAIDGQLRTVFMAIVKMAIPKALELCEEQADAAQKPARAPGNGAAAGAKPGTGKP